MASRSLGTLTVDLLLKMGGFKQGMDQAARAADRNAKSIEKSFGQMSRRIDSVRRGVVGLLGGIATVATVRSIIQVADEYTRLEGRLRLVAESTQDLERVQSSLFGVAQRTRTEFAGVADLYVRLAQSAGELGASEQDLLRFTEGVSNALIVSGTSAQQASGALLQLSQALGAGVVRAEEFNSLLEGAPEIVRVVAQSIDRFGGSVSKLRTAVLAGEVSSREFFEAFLRGSDALRARAESMPVTVGQAFTQLRNVVNRTIGEADLSPLVDSINELSKTVSDPGFQQGMAAFVALVIRLTGAAASAAASVGKLTVATSENYRLLTGQMSEQERRLLAIKRIEADLSAKSWLDKDIGFLLVSNNLLRERLELLKAQSGIGQPTGPTNPRGRRAPVASEAGLSPQDEKAAAKLFEQTRTAAERFRVEMAELDRLLKVQAITPEVYQRRVAQLREELNKPGKTPKIVDDLEAMRDAYADILDTGLAAIQGLETPLETQLRTYQETKFALEQLRDTYPALADAADEALARLAVTDLEPITITAEKIFPKEEREQLSEFWLQASRNVQDILADFIFDPFSKGIDGLIEDFGRMLQQMAAQAIAADIAGKIFGTGGMGAGGGLLGSFLGGLGGFFGGQGWGSMAGLGEIAVTAKRIPGFDEGGYTGDGSKSDPAGVVHRGEFVTRSEVLKESGARSFLERFNDVGMSAITEILSDRRSSREYQDHTFAADVMRLRSDAASESIRDSTHQSTTAAHEKWFAGTVETLRSTLRSIIGYDSGGYTGAGGKFEPAGIVHRGEFVARSEVVREPGARSFLETFNRIGMDALASLPGFAAGGFVGGMGLDAPLAAAAAVPSGSAGGMTLNQNFTIHAPSGTVSRATEQQLAAAAARGAARANARNN